VLYKEYLHNPGQAAKCLEAGGLLPEAIEIYWEMQEFEKAGDLYATMGNADAAAAAYQRAVDKCLKSKDHLRAAWLLEYRIQAPDEALDILWNAWPVSPQAPTCLKEHFSLLARQGRHADALRRTEELRACPKDRAVPLTEVLAALAGQYPYAPVGNQMADVARVVAGRAMPLASHDDVARLTATVASLVPSDRLLLRDTDRYLRSRRIAPRPAPLTKLTRLSWIALPDGVWSSFAATPDYLCAAGSVEPVGWLKVVVHDWTNTQGSAEWAQFATLAERPLLVARPIGQRSIIAVGRRNERLNLQHVPLAGPMGRLEVGTPSWLPIPLLAAAGDAEGAVLAVTAGKEEFLVSRFSPSGELVWTRNAKRCERHKNLSCTIIPQAGGFFMAVDGCVFHSTGADDNECHRMDEAVLGIAACFDGAEHVHAVSTRSGGWVLRGNAKEDALQRRDEHDGELGPPDFPGESLVTFLGNDLMVAVTESGGGVYHLDGGSVIRYYDLPNHPARPLAVMAGPRPRTFAVASEHRVDLYELPRI
jgi:hypothetical protein